MSSTASSVAAVSNICVFDLNSVQRRTGEETNRDDAVSIEARIIIKFSCS